MNYQQALDYIHGTYQFGSKLGLENIQYLLSLLGNPHKSLKIIHVAGTNGKGSTSSFIHSILKAQGYKVGLYTSPYLEEFTERIRINGADIPKERLAQITQQVKEKIEEMVREGRNHPTEFEVVTAIAFCYYAQEAVDFVVLEVGLGGRLDATNVVEDPLLSVITTIGYDHMEYLGNTLEKIAFEKGGIIKENGFVLSYPQGKEVIGVLEEICQQRRSQLFVADFSSLLIQESTVDGQIFSVKVREEDYDNLQIQLLGKHQVYNSIMALWAVYLLRRYRSIKISREAIYRGLYDAKWAGRFEVLGHNPLTIIDGAHNVNGAEALRESMVNLLQGREITFVVGMLKDKDVRGTLDCLMPLVKKVVATKPNNPRAMEPGLLAEALRSYGKEVYTSLSIIEAIEKAFVITDPKEVIVFAGSLYMIGEVRKQLRK